MGVAYSENMNRGRFETWTSRPELDLYSVRQVHGVELASASAIPCDADGLVFAWDELDKPLAIKTADCMPIVIEGKLGVVFLHAGWRGLADGILERTEIRDIEPLRVLIGPSIHLRGFEVSEEFKHNFPNSPFFKEIDGRYHFDLQQEARARLHAIYPNLLIDIAPVCTFENETFNSYRRNKTAERNWNLYIKG
jgi:polyphenol oxidase